MKYLLSRFAAIGVGVYLLVFLGASLYPLFNRQTFAGLFAVMLAWPWIDYLPSSHFALVLAVALNSVTIYFVLALITLCLPSRPK